MPDREKYEEPVRVSITRRPTAIFSRLGFALLLVATALYLAHVDSRLGPPIRVGLGVVVSIFLCFLGQWLEKRTKIFGQVVFAVGLGFAYFLAFGVSSFDLLKLFDSFYGGLAVQAGVAAVAIYIAAKKRNENLAGFWIFLAYLSCASSFFPSVTPLIWENARLVLGAGLVLGLAMFVLIWLRAWTRLPFLGVLCVYGLHSVWLLYAGISETANGVSAQTVFDQNFAFLVLYTAVFHGMAILLSFSPSRARSLLIFNHAAVLGLLVLQCACWTISGRPASMALAGLGLAILVSTIIFWRLRSLRPLAGIQLIVTGVFLAAAAVYSATPLNAAAAWAVIGLLVLICGLQGLGSISIVAGGVMTALSSLLAVSWPWIRPLILGDTPGVGGIFNMTPQEAGAITQLVQTSGPSAVAVGATAIAHRLCADKRERAFAELGENRFVWTERLLFIAFVVHLLAVWVYHFTSVDLPFIASLIGVVILFCGHRRIASLGYIAIALSLWYHVLMFFAVGLPKAGLWQSSPLQIAIRQLAPVTLPTSGLLGSVLLASGAMVVDAIRVRVTGLDKAQTGQGKFGLIVACLGVGMASVVAGMTFSAAWWIWFPVLVGVMLLVATFIAGRMEFAYGGVFAWFGAHVLSWVFSFSSADGNLGGYSIQGLGLWALFGVSVLVCLWGRRRARFDTVFADLLSPSLLLFLLQVLPVSMPRIGVFGLLLVATLAYMALRLFWAPQSRVIVVPLIFAALFGLLLTGMTIGGTAGWLGYRVYYSLACVALIYGTDLLAERIVGTNGGGIGNELLAPFVSGLLLVGSLPVMFSVSTTIAMLSVAGVVWFLSGPRGRMLSWRIGGIWIVCLAALAPLGSPWTWMCPNQSRYSVVLLSVSAVALLILERALAFSSFGLRGLRSYWRRVRGKNVSIVAATLLLARLIGSGVQPNVQFLYFAGLGVVLVVVGRMAGARGWRFAGAVVVIVGGIRYAVFDLACSPVNEGIYYLITYGVAMILVSIAFKATVRVVSQTGNRLPMKDDSDG